MTPTQNIMHQALMEYFRPKAFAKGAAIKAPIKVPIDKSPTINPDRVFVNWGVGGPPGFLGSGSNSPKRWRKSCISRKPEI